MPERKSVQVLGVSELKYNATVSSIVSFCKSSALMLIIDKIN